VNREITTLDPELFMWLRCEPEHGPVPGWEPQPPLAELRCSTDLVGRLALVARPIAKTTRRFVAGCPVIHHPEGRPIAVAEGSSWIAIRSDLPAGALRNDGTHVPPLSEFGWVELDPWAPDTAFARAVDLMRAHVARAYEMAEDDS
jgi:hypothetical protein